MKKSKRIIKKYNKLYKETKNNFKFILIIFINYYILFYLSINTYINLYFDNY